MEMARRWGTRVSRDTFREVALICITKEDSAVLEGKVPTLRL